MPHNDYFDRIDSANAAINAATTVDEIIAICDKHFPAEIAAGADGDSFYPGGADEDLFSSLNLDTWTFPWIRSEFFFSIQDPQGNIMTYIEGDLYRGNRR